LNCGYVRDWDVPGSPRLPLQGQSPSRWFQTRSHAGLVSNATATHPWFLPCSALSCVYMYVCILLYTRVNSSLKTGPLNTRRLSMYQGESAAFRYVLNTTQHCTAILCVFDLECEDVSRCCPFRLCTCGPTARKQGHTTGLLVSIIELRHVQSHDRSSQKTL
jgi:hypothetical protein